MREFHIIFVYLACVSHGQDFPHKEQNSPSINVQEPSRSLAKLLLGGNPAGWVNPVRGRAKPRGKKSSWASIPSTPTTRRQHRRVFMMPGDSLVVSQHPDIVPYKTSAFSPHNPDWLLEEALKTKLRILGPTHPSALSSMHDWALQLKRDGYLTDAKEDMERVVITRSSTLGFAHPDTLDSKHELGMILHALGDLGEAEEIQREVLEARTETLQKCMSRLDGFGSSAKDTEIAQEAIKHSLEAKDKLAQTLRVTGDRVDLREAEELQREVLQGKIDLLGPENPEVIECTSNLAKTLEEIGSTESREEAEALSKQAEAATLRLSYMQTGTSGADLEAIRQAYYAPTDEELAEKATQTPSHLQIDLDDEEEQAKKGPYMFVEESKCVGCTWCAYVAPNTFFMEPETQRARAYTQGREDPDVLTEAVNCCPSSCIYFVDLEDLIIMETERDDWGRVPDIDAVVKGASGGFGGRQFVGSAKYSRGNSDFVNGGFVKLDQEYAARQKRKARRHLNLKEEKKESARQEKLDRFFDLLSQKIDTPGVSVNQKIDTPGVSVNQKSDTAGLSLSQKIDTQGVSPR